MIQSLDIRRHPDGSIDFDFYRRRATRQRRLARRLVLTHYLILIGQVVEIIISAIERSARPYIGSYWLKPEQADGHSTAGSAVLTGMHSRKLHNDIH